MQDRKGRVFSQSTLDELEQLDCVTLNACSHSPVVLLLIINKVKKICVLLVNECKSSKNIAPVVPQNEVYLCQT